MERERRVNENNRADGSKSRRIPAKNHTQKNPNKKEIFFISLNKEKKDHREN